jgi:GT2 family glycosyltransferase
VPDAGEHVGQLLLSVDRETVVELASGEARRAHRIGSTPAWVDVPLSGPAVDVLNSTGAMLVDGGYGADRGYLEPDEGQYDTEADVFAWSGAAALLSGRYLADVGTFADDYFLYYEDFDLSWRGRLAGWRYRYIPTSIVRHVHAASSGATEASPLFRHYDERNRLLTLARNAPTALAVGAPARSLLITLSYIRRDVLGPLLHGRGPRPDIPRWRIRALVAFLRMAPSALRARRRIRRRRTVGDEAILGWMVTGESPVVGS